MTTQIQRRKAAKDKKKDMTITGSFFLCESCFWSATSLYSAIKEKQNSETTTSTDNPTHVCPMCDKDSVVLVPLQENEAIKCQWDTKEVSIDSFLYRSLKIVAYILTFEDPSPFNISLGLQHIS